MVDIPKTTSLSQYLPISPHYTPTISPLYTYIPFIECHYHAIPCPVLFFSWIHIAFRFVLTRRPPPTCCYSQRISCGQSTASRGIVGLPGSPAVEQSVGFDESMFWFVLTTDKFWLGNLVDRPWGMQRNAKQVKMESLNDLLLVWVKKIVKLFSKPQVSLEEHWRTMFVQLWIIAVSVCVCVPFFSLYRILQILELDDL